MRIRLIQGRRLLLATLAFAGCRAADAEPAGGAESAAEPKPGQAADAAVWQLAPFAMLARGAYDGILPVSEVKRHGDHGLGAADRLNGEMALVDGRFYQFLSDGRTVEAADSMRMPFAAVTRWTGGRDVPVPGGSTYPALQAALDGALPTTDAFYAVRVEGTWDVVVTRTYRQQPKQPKKYPPLDSAAVDTFVIREARGTMVGFREPSYADSLSVPNYHLHFVTADGAQGGHVKSFTARDVRAQVSERPDFILRMPPAPAAAP